MGCDPYRVVILTKEGARIFLSIKLLLIQPKVVTHEQSFVDYKRATNF